MSTTNHFISLSHGETVNGNRLSASNSKTDRDRRHTSFVASRVSVVGNVKKYTLGHWRVRVNTSRRGRGTDPHVRLHTCLVRPGLNSKPPLCPVSPSEGTWRVRWRKFGQNNHEWTFTGQSIHTNCKVGSVRLQQGEQGDGDRVSECGVF